MRVPLLQPALDYDRSLIRKLTVFRQTGRGRSWRTPTFRTLVHTYTFATDRWVSHVPVASKFVGETNVVIILPFYWCRACAHLLFHNCFLKRWRAISLSHVKKLVVLVDEISKNATLYYVELVLRGCSSHQRMTILTTCMSIYCVRMM